MYERTRSGSPGPNHRPQFDTVRFDAVRFDTVRARLGALGFVAVVALAACGSSAGATATPAAAVTAGPAATATSTAAPGVTATPAGPTTVASGAFHDVDGTAAGEVTLVHLAGGAFEVVFENFSIASNAHTNVILLPVADVTKDGDVDKTAILDLGPLKATAGMQDFLVPSTADAMGFHTVVLWDTEMAHAIAAAPLR